jgi:hypothetical protein
MGQRGGMCRQSEALERLDLALQRGVFGAQRGRLGGELRGPRFAGLDQAEDGRGAVRPIERRRQPTYSYYGVLNRVSFNVGYHVEHHDFPAIPWRRLPRLQAMAREDYEGLFWIRSWTLLLVEYVARDTYRVDHYLGMGPTLEEEADGHLEHRDLDGIRALGIDEVAYRKGHKFLTLVYQIDADRRRLLWVTESRTQAAIASFFTWFGEARSKALHVVRSLTMAFSWTHAPVHRALRIQGRRRHDAARSRLGPRRQSGRDPPQTRPTTPPDARPTRRARPGASG